MKWIKNWSYFFLSARLSAPLFVRPLPFRKYACCFSFLPLGLPPPRSIHIASPSCPLRMPPQPPPSRRILPLLLIHHPPLPSSPPSPRRHVPLHFFRPRQRRLSNLASSPLAPCAARSRAEGCRFYCPPPTTNSPFSPSVHRDACCTTVGLMPSLCSHISLSMPSLHAAPPHLYGVSGSPPPPCSWVSGSPPPLNQE